MPTHAPYAQWQDSTALALEPGTGSVSVAPEILSLPGEGFSGYLSASATAPDGFPSATSFAWTSSDLSIATVSPTGYVQAVTAGTAMVRATSPSGAYDEASIQIGIVYGLGVDANNFVTLGTPPYLPTGETDSFLIVDATPGTPGVRLSVFNDMVTPYPF